MRLRPSAVVLSLTAAWTLACASDRETLNNWLSAPADGWVGTTFTVRESINYSGHADDWTFVGEQDFSGETLWTFDEDKSDYSIMYLGRWPRGEVIAPDGHVVQFDWFTTELNDELFVDLVLYEDAGIPGGPWNFELVDTSADRIEFAPAPDSADLLGTDNNGTNYRRLLEVNLVLER
jgi:hypothetical protein